MFDLVIRDALLLDGLGSAPARGDLAVAGDRIAAMGKVEGSAKTTLDAGGLALMPGIVDNHTHYDAQITWDPGVAPSPELGVTTAVIEMLGALGVAHLCAPVLSTTRASPDRQRAEGRHTAGRVALASNRQGHPARRAQANLRKL